MTQRQADFLALICLAADTEVLKRLTFSRPAPGQVKKISGRLCAHRGQKILALEYAVSDNTVTQRNLRREEWEAELAPLFCTFCQVNLTTGGGDAEYKRSAGGKEVCLGMEKLHRKLTNTPTAFATAIGALDEKKQYLLNGTEPFLLALGISDASGRVHDKMQGKFRQINRFLEHLRDLYDRLPKEGDLCIYDLCCGKSYLSFAVYHYLTVMQGRTVDMLCVDLKESVIRYCESTALRLGYGGMRFAAEDISTLPADAAPPHMVISLHACDIATDIVLKTAIRLRAGIVLSTPCCQRYLSDRLNAPALSFVTDYPHLRRKLSDTLTDAIRLCYLRAGGYRVSAPELTDPTDTPKNTLLRAVLDPTVDKEKARGELRTILQFVLGDEAESSIWSDICKQ